LTASLQEKGTAQQIRVAVLEASPNLTPAETVELAMLKVSAPDIQTDLASIQKAAAELKTQMDLAPAPDAGEQELGALTAFLPPPWNGLAGLFGGGAVMWLRQRGVRKAFGQLVTAMNTAKAKHPDLATALDAASETMHANMDTSVISTIDKARTNGGVPII
jgi:hypothetical protein